MKSSLFEADPGKNAVLLSENGRRRALVRIDASIASRIACRPVFHQSVLDNRRNSSAMPVHRIFTNSLTQIVQCLFDLFDQQFDLGFLFAQAFHYLGWRLSQELLIPQLAFRIG